MTQDDIVQQYDISIEQSGLFSALLDVGFSPKEVKIYLELEKNANAVDEQIRMLRKQRYGLTDDIQRLQQLLDQIDFIIWNILRQRLRKFLTKVRQTVFMEHIAISCYD